jgi:hypothetical protein
VNGGPKRESIGHDDAQMEERIIAALASVSSHIDVPPCPFVPPAEPLSKGRTSRAPRTAVMWAAMVVVIVGLTGTAVIVESRVEDEVVTTAPSGDDDESPVTYDVPLNGTLDAAFLDYVAPINGDHAESAEFVFVNGYAWARAESIRKCLEQGGLPEGVASWTLAVTDWYAFHRSPVQSRLPSLRVIADQGVIAPEGDEVVSRDVSEAVTRCSERDRSKPSRWLRRVVPLQEEFTATVGDVIAMVEAGPSWGHLRRCLTQAEAPENDDRGRPLAHIQDYLDWLGEAAEDDTVSLSDEDGGGLPEARDFVRCATPFYAEVERALAGPRASFVEKHRDELLILQAQFASFA